MRAILSNGIVGVATGFMMRPCCALPAVLSLAGIGSAGAAGLAMTYRPVFLLLSITAIAASSWVTLRREGGRFNKCLSIGAAGCGLIVSSRLLGVF
jgi:hypothetical protein